MRLLKLALISFVGLFIVVFAISLFMPAHVRVSRAINIGADKEKILADLSDMRQWPSWNQMTPDTGNRVRITEKEYKAGDLEVKITGTGPDSVHTAWTLPDRHTIRAHFYSYQAGDTTVVQWYFDFYQRWYPWEKFKSVFYDKQMGPVMERSLERLRAKMENGF